jgi:hypothetical protein
MFPAGGTYVVVVVVVVQGWNVALPVVFVEFLQAVEFGPRKLEDLGFTSTWSELEEVVATIR